MPQPGRLMLICLGAVSPALPLIGCASSAPAPVANDAPFSGPAITIDASGAEYIAVVQAPTPGWEITLTQAVPGYHYRASFITLRRPYPGAMYSQMIVEQHVSLGVPTRDTIRLYAREVDFEEPRQSEAPFMFVAQASPGTAPPAPESPPPATQTPTP